MSGVCCNLCNAYWSARPTGERWTFDGERHAIIACQSCGTRYVIVMHSEPDGGTWVSTRDVIVLAVTGTP